MRVSLSPSMRRITISTSAYIDPLRLKVVARYWSFRCAIFSLLGLAFVFPLASITAALVRLESISACRSVDCLYFGRKSAPAHRTTTYEFDNHWDSAPAALVAALKAGSEVQSLHDDLPDTIDQLVAQASVLHFDTATLIFKLKAMVELHEERARMAKLQRALYRHFASKGIPKGLHCLALRLTVEHTVNPAARRPLPPPAARPRLRDAALRHVVLITDNLFAASVVVASAVANAAAPAGLVFHVVTDRVTHTAMRAWFSLNPPGPAALEVLGAHEFAWLTKENVPVLDVVENSEALKRHYYGDAAGAANPGDPPSVLAARLQERSPKYISIMNHLRMYLPEVFPQLEKVVFLDDDVVVQKDLAPLWDVPLGGKVNGAVETCHGADKWVMSKRFKSYLNFSSPLIAERFDPERCAWAYGVNVFDLAAWRRSDITSTYHYWQKQNLLANLTLWRLGTLPPALIAFDGYVQPIDPSWHMLGLGYQPESDHEAIRNAAVIHFNGPAKPWLDMAISDFKPYWTKYVNYSNNLIHKCNIFNF